MKRFIFILSLLACGLTYAGTAPFKCSLVETTPATGPAGAEHPLVVNEVPFTNAFGESVPHWRAEMEFKFLKGIVGEVRAYQDLSAQKTLHLFINVLRDDAVKNKNGYYVGNYDLLYSAEGSGSHSLGLQTTLVGTINPLAPKAEALSFGVTCR